MGCSPPPPPSGTGRSDDRSAADPRRLLNPDAPPFSPTSGAGPSHVEADFPEGICFSLPSDSEDEDEELNWIPPSSSPKGKGKLPEGRRRSTSPVRGSGGFMADARRSSSVAAPPSQMRGDPLVDADGFRTVVYKRHARGLHAFLAAHDGRSPPTWWGNASTAWQRTMWPPAAPSRRAASAASKSAMWPRTANVPASRVLRGGVAAPLDGSCLQRTSLQRPTSGAGATRRALPLLLRRGRLLRVAPTPALHQSAQPRRWVARHHRKLAHGRISLGGILLGVRNSSLELYHVLRSCSKPRTLLRPLPWSCW